MPITIKSHPALKVPRSGGGRKARIQHLVEATPRNLLQAIKRLRTVRQEMSAAHGDNWGCAWLEIDGMHIVDLDLFWVAKVQKRSREYPELTFETPTKKAWRLIAGVQAQMYRPLAFWE